MNWHFISIKMSSDPEKTIVPPSLLNKMKPDYVVLKGKINIDSIKCDRCECEHCESVKSTSPKSCNCAHCVIMTSRQKNEQIDLMPKLVLRIHRGDDDNDGKDGKDGDDGVPDYDNLIKELSLVDYPGCIASGVALYYFKSPDEGAQIRVSTRCLDYYNNRENELKIYETFMKYIPKNLYEISWHNIPSNYENLYHQCWTNETDVCG